MKKMKIAVAVLAGVVLAGCANQDIYSGNVYEGDQAKQTTAFSYGEILSVRPVKIQAKSEGIIGTVGGGVLGGMIGSTVGGGSGRNIATAAAAIAGAIAGSKAEEKINQVNAAELVIKKDNGQQIVVVQKAIQVLYLEREFV